MTESGKSTYSAFLTEDDVSSVDSTWESITESNAKNDKSQLSSSRNSPKHLINDNAIYKEMKTKYDALLVVLRKLFITNLTPVVGTSIFFIEIIISVAKYGWIKGGFVDAIIKSSLYQWEAPNLNKINFGIIFGKLRDRTKEMGMLPVNLQRLKWKTGGLEALWQNVIEVARENEKRAKKVEEKWRERDKQAREAGKQIKPIPVNQLKYQSIWLYLQCGDAQRDTVFVCYMNRKWYLVSHRDRIIRKQRFDDPQQCINGPHWLDFGSNHQSLTKFIAKNVFIPYSGNKDIDSFDADKRGKFVIDVYGVGMTIGYLDKPKEGVASETLCSVKRNLQKMKELQQEYGGKRLSREKYLNFGKFYVPGSSYGWNIDKAKQCIKDSIIDKLYGKLGEWKALRSSSPDDAEVFFEKEIKSMLSIVAYAQVFYLHHWEIKFFQYLQVTKVLEALRKEWIALWREADI